MKNTNKITAALLLTSALLLPACSPSSEDDHGHTHGEESHDHQSTDTGNTHVHDDGSTHADHDTAAQDGHEVIQLEPVTIGGLELILTQNHGPVEAGAEEHLVIQIAERGDEILAVRAWIGTEDRTYSFVGKGEYVLLTDTYEIHTIAPDPIPEDAMWWIEIEQTNGTKAIGSVKPIM